MVKQERVDSARPHARVGLKPCKMRAIGSIPVSLFKSVLLAPLAFLLTISSTHAHPHVFVSGKTELVFAPDGTLSAIRHAWTFDEMFSSFSAQGLDKNGLAALAKENVEALKELNYFTKAKIAGKQIDFDDPSEYSFVADDKKLLTLHFTLRVKGSSKSNELSVEIYDPAYFIAFSFAEQDAVILTGSSARCSANLKKPAENDADQSESFFSQLQAGAEYGAQFATRITVRCR